MPTLKELFEKRDLDNNRHREKILLALYDLTPKEKKSIFFSIHQAFDEKGQPSGFHRPGWRYLFDTLAEFKVTETTNQSDLNGFAIQILAELISPAVFEWIINQGNTTKKTDIIYLADAITIILARQDIHPTIKSFLLFETDLLTHSDFLTSLKNENLFRSVLKNMTNSNQISKGLFFLKTIHDSLTQKDKSIVLTEMLLEFPNILLQFNENQWTADSFLNFLYLFTLFAEQQKLPFIIKTLFKHMQVNLAEMQPEVLEDYSPADEQQEKDALIAIILDDLNKLTLDKLKDYPTSKAKERAQMQLNLFKQDLVKSSTKLLDDYLKKYTSIAELLSRVQGDDGKKALEKLRNYISPQEKSNISTARINTSRSRILDNFANNPKLCLFFIHHLNQILGNKDDITQYNIFITLYHKPDSYLRILLMNLAIHHEDLLGNSIANYLIDSPKDARERTRSASFSFEFRNPYKKNDRQLVKSKIKHLSEEVKRELPIPCPFAEEIPVHLLAPIDNTTSTASTPQSYISRGRTNTASSSASYNTASTSPYSSKATLDSISVISSPRTSGKEVPSTQGIISMFGNIQASRTVLSDSSSDKSDDRNESPSTTSTTVANTTSTHKFSNNGFFSSRVSPANQNERKDSNNNDDDYTDNNNDKDTDNDLPFPMDTNEDNSHRYQNTSSRV